MRNSLPHRGMARLSKKSRAPPGGGALWTHHESRQIKQQYFAGTGAACDLDASLFRDCGPIAGLEILAIDRRRTARHLDPSMTSRTQFVLHSIRFIQCRDVDLRILIQLHGVTAVAAAG